MIEVKKHGILLKPTELKFEDQGVANPACTKTDGKIHMFYRNVRREYPGTNAKKIEIVLITSKY